MIWTWSKNQKCITSISNMQHFVSIRAFQHSFVFGQYMCLETAIITVIMQQYQVSYDYGDHNDYGDPEGCTITIHHDCDNLVIRIQNDDGRH